MKLICNKEILGQTAVRSFTTPNTGNQGSYVKTIVGVGNPFWMWPSVPAGKIIGADFTDAPICSDDVNVNNQLIAAITVLPEDVLVYETP